MTKRFLLGLFLALGLLSGAHAAGGGVALDKFPTERVTNLPALQNGARLFVNYCLNCHSASYMRYNRMRDIGLSDEQIKNNLMFAAKKVGDPMTITLDPVQAKDWFGAAPPDLTVVARSRAGNGGQRRRLPVHLHAHLLPRRQHGHRLEQPGLPERRRCRTCCGNCRASSARCSPSEKDPHDPTKTHAVFKGFEPMTRRHAEHRASTTRRWPTWWPSCSGWPSRTRASACAWACSCCCSWPCSP